MGVRKHRMKTDVRHTKKKKHTCTNTHNLINFCKSAARSVSGLKTTERWARCHAVIPCVALLTCVPSHLTPVNNNSSPGTQNQRQQAANTQLPNGNVINKQMSSVCTTGPQTSTVDVCPLARRACVCECVCVCVL